MPHGHRTDGPHARRDTSATAPEAGRPPVDVLVVGAGPTGLTAAIEAVRHGLRVRIVDRKPQRTTFSRALVVHARTLEVFETMGLADAVLAEGTPFAALTVRTGRRRRPTRVDLLGLAWGDTSYPFWLSVPQYATERVLEDHLRRLGVEVEWRVEFRTYRDHGEHVETTLAHQDGGRQTVRSRWLLGCDGGRSRVRGEAGLRLDRTDAGAVFILADVRTTAALPENEGHAFLGPDGLLLIVPMPEPRRWRVIAHVRQPPDPAPAIDAASLDALIRRRAGLEFGSHDVVWSSHFSLSHGVADRYRRGRVFLAGDAAHVHSPVGGQGLNTGVQDAHNLLWKLGLAGELPAEVAELLLDSYEAERRAVAGAMVRGVARVTGVLTRGSGLRRRLVGAVAPRLLARHRVQQLLGRRVGMLEVGYRAGPLAGVAGDPVGRRMPNPCLRAGGRLYHRLDPVRHTWVVRLGPGDPPADPADPAWRGYPLVQVCDGDLAPDSAGAHVPPVVLVRPDRYIAAAAESADPVLPAPAAVWRP